LERCVKAAAPFVDAKVIKISQGGDMKISQAMIVKNEEKNIEKALSWGKGIVAEQIVVDTGSTDRTVEIAKKKRSQEEIRAMLEECNEKIARCTKQETAELLDKVLFEASSVMKNSYSRSDA